MPRLFNVSFENKSFVIITHQYAFVFQLTITTSEPHSPISYFVATKQSDWNNTKICYSYTEPNSLTILNPTVFNVEISKLNLCLFICPEFGDSYSVTLKEQFHFSLVLSTIIGLLLLIFADQFSKAAWLFYGVMGTLIGSVVWMTSIWCVIRRLPWKLRSKELTIASFFSGLLLTYKCFKFLSFHFSTLLICTFVIFSSLGTSCCYIYGPVTSRATNVFCFYLKVAGASLVLMGNINFWQLGIVEILLSLLLPYVRTLLCASSFSLLTKKAAQSQNLLEQPSSSHQNFLQPFPLISLEEYNETDTREHLLLLAKYINSDDCDREKLFSKLRNPSKVALFAVSPVNFINSGGIESDFSSTDSDDESENGELNHL